MGSVCGAARGQRDAANCFGYTTRGCQAAHRERRTAQRERVTIDLGLAARCDRDRPRRHRGAAGGAGRHRIVGRDGAVAGTKHSAGRGERAAANVLRQKCSCRWRRTRDAETVTAHQPEQAVTDTAQVDAGAAVINLARRAVEAGAQGLRTDGQRAKGVATGSNAVIAGLRTGEADDRFLVTAGIGGGRQCDRTGQLGGGKDTHRAADRVATDHSGQRRRANTCRSAVAAAAVCHAVGQCQRVDRQRAGGVGDGVVARQCAAAGNGVAGADRVQTHAEVAICAVRRIGRSG